MRKDLKVTGHSNIFFCMVLPSVKGGGGGYLDINTRKTVFFLLKLNCCF